MDVMAMNPVNICLQESRIMTDTSDRGGLLGHFQKRDKVWKMGVPR